VANDTSDRGPIPKISPHELEEKIAAELSNDYRQQQIPSVRDCDQHYRQTPAGTCYVVFGEES